MKYTVKELTRLNLVSVIDNERIITIDKMHNIVYVNAPGDICPAMELRTNKNHVLKLNKKSISTCNVDMLVYMLANSEPAFVNVYAYIKIGAIMPDETKKRLVDETNTTKAAFYNSFNDNLPALVELFKYCTNETRQTIIRDHVCYNHESKMNGIVSLSTCVSNNKYCIARCKNCAGAICKYCYAASLTKQRVALKNKLQRITAILTAIKLRPYDVPTLDPALYPFFRFESFGDLNNTLQFENYNLIAAMNQDINFTIWTKNPGIIQACINAGLQLANNLVIGLSSLYLNKPEIDKAQKYSFIRFLFTVYDDQYIKDHNIKINCGAKHCLSCGICYKYLHEYKNSGLMIINERKK